MRKALGAVALIVALGDTQLASGAALGAATLNEVRLKPGPDATELVLVVEGPCPYKVERDGVADLKVRLPAAKAAPGLSTQGLADGRVEVAVEEGAKELLVRVRAKRRPLGYVQLPTPAGLSLLLFGDAPGLELPKEVPKPAPQASPKAKGEKFRAGQRQPLRLPNAPGPKLAEPKSQAAEPAEPSRPAPAPPAAPEKHLKDEPLALLADSGGDAPQGLEMAELPETGPELGGLLPGSKPPEEDKLLRQLLRSRESEAAYAEAAGQLEAGDYELAQGHFSKIEATYPRTVAGARASFRIADCLYGPATGEESREAATRAYLEAVSKSPLRDEVGRAYLQIGRLYQLGGYDYEAVSYLGLVIKQQPDSPYALRAYLLRGDLYFKAGKYKEAVNEYAQVGRLFPNSLRVREANFKLVRCLFARKDFEGVERAYREMRQRWPETFAADPGLLRYIGETYFQQGDYARCREFLFYVLNIYPEATANHLIMGRIADAYLAEGNHREAAKLYRLLMTTFPGSEGAQMARMRLAEDDLAEGKALVDGLASGEKKLGELALYQEITAGEGRAAQRAKVRIGLWYYWRRDYLKAAEVLRGRLREDKGLEGELARDCRYALSEALYRQLRVYFDQGRFAEMVKLQLGWGEFVEGERAETFYYLGEGFRRAHLAADAARCFLKAQSLPWREDKRQETLFGLGLARLETGEYGQAAQSLRQLVEAYPDYPGRFEALRALGKASYLSGSYKAAVSALEEALQLRREPETRAGDFYLLGLVLLGLKDAERAAAAFEESLAACASYGCDKLLEAEASLELGNALYALERWEEAGRAYGRVATLAPGGPEAQQALYKAGKCYVALGRREEAVSAFGQGAAAGQDGIWKKASAQMLEGLEMGTNVP
jgi:TolA-binding protein